MKKRKLPSSPNPSIQQSSDLDDRPEAAELLAKLKSELPSLDQLLEKYSDHWRYEDPIYRFYHHSFKVIRLRNETLEIVAKLQALAPERKLNDDFMEIVRDGTEKTVGADARSLVEAFFHARFFLEMAVRYGRELKQPPHCLPSGWAAFLYLFNLR